MPDNSTLFDDRELTVIWHALSQVSLPDSVPVAPIRAKVEAQLGIGTECEACGNVRGVSSLTRFACPDCWEAV